MSTIAPIGRVPVWSFGDRIRKVRRELGMSQAAFAEALGEGDKAVAAWEAGRNKPGDIVALAQRIETLSGYPAAWILGLIDGPGPGNNPGSSGTTDRNIGGIRRNRDGMSVTSDSLASSLTLSQDLLDAA